MSSNPASKTRPRGTLPLVAIAAAGIAAADRLPFGTHRAAAADSPLPVADL
jgi:hypothetical protein